MQRQLEYLCSQDEKLQAIIEAFGEPIVQKRPPGFVAMCHIILEQQVSIESAKACYVKLEQNLGGVTPQNILSASAEELRLCGVSRQKTGYLKDLAHRVQSGALDFESFSTKSPDQITSELLAIKGVGPWTVEVYLMFCLQSPDVMPFGDIAIRNTIKAIYDVHEIEGMQLLSQKWKPYRSLASFILWHHYLKTRNKI